MVSGPHQSQGKKKKNMQDPNHHRHVTQTAPQIPRDPNKIPPHQQATSTSNSPRIPNTPQLHPQNLKLLPLIAKRLIPKRRTRATNPLLQVIIQPKPIVPIATADAKKRRLAQHQVVVDAAVGKSFEAEPLGRARSRAGVGCSGCWESEAGCAG